MTDDLTTKEKTELKIEILEQYFPDECEIVGASNIKPIAEGSREFIETEYGVNMPIMEVVALIVTIVGFIDSILSVIERLIKLRSKRITSEEVVMDVKSSVDLPEELDQETIEKICDYVLKRLQEKDA